MAKGGPCVFVCWDGGCSVPRDGATEKHKRELSKAKACGEKIYVHEDWHGNML